MVHLWVFSNFCKSSKKFPIYLLKKIYVSGTVQFKPVLRVNCILLFIDIIGIIILNKVLYVRSNKKNEIFFKINFVSEIGSIFFLFFKFYLWLCWVFVSVRGLSLVVANGGHSSSWCAGLSLSWPLLLRSTGSRRAGSVIVAHGPSCSVAGGIFPDQGSNPRPLHWQADSQPLRHQGSPSLDFEDIDYGDDLSV